MNDVKVNLTLLVRGANMMSEQECSKQLKNPVVHKKGKQAGKQTKGKSGNLLYNHNEVPDLSKYDKHTMTVSGEEGKETITFYTRKQKMIKQTLNISTEAYNYFISNEMPQGYKAPEGFKPYMPTRSRLDRKAKKQIEGVSKDIQSWKKLNVKQRLEWHLNSICEGLMGTLESYTVFED